MIQLYYYNMCECIAVIACSLHERNTMRTTFVSKCSAFKLENNWNTKMSFYNIFCIWHRYNIIFASLKCVCLILQFHCVIFLSYAWNSIVYNCMKFNDFENAIRELSNFSFWATELIFEFSIDSTFSNRLSQFIQWFKCLSIFRTIIVR